MGVLYIHLCITPFLDLEDDAKDGPVLNMLENTKAFAQTTRNKAPRA